MSVLQLEYQPSACSEDSEEEQQSKKKKKRSKVSGSEEWMDPWARPKKGEKNRGKKRRKKEEVGLLEV